ncbi:uncharacterized protein DNG_01287 [Cephalotrichum gorgonifer]|uniref:MMS19 nucleotide excision repair protein n=1 Tax=Cephalotrichum gorgonifer TaxID=2041049 RepID=A0AAE8MSB4_9PEZI|nr:uncharacterized protein DNG_01287 [Cephalotrichum gorgonifer]
MADFKQLALEFVLTEDKENQVRIATKAAESIKSSPSSSLPVARWVESIRPWMPGSEDAGMPDAGDGASTGDIIARARALQFLASTLQVLDEDVLIPAHIKLLNTFFGAMFSVDHKAGILPSAQALTTISSLKAFPAHAGHEIIRNVCAMGDDFQKQVAETRLAIFDLFYHLIADPKVANDLKLRHSTYDFVDQMLSLFGNERDPKNLIRWFSIIEILLTKYSPPPELTEKMFGAYSAYFPISLRTSKHPSGITPEDLKLALRACFAADDRVASHAIPFLIQKLNQGEGVSVDVKLDILRTLKACVVRYQTPQASVVPFVSKIWNCLKYEVRNGEVEETINATLEMIRAMAARLEGDALRNFILTVLRECLDDLSNPTYAAQAGKLLVCTASASVSAFVLILSPAAKQVMEDLRHTKSRDHKRDLLSLLNAILGVRSLFTNGEAGISGDDLVAMELTEPVLHSLFDLAYKPCLQSPDALVSKKAVEGMGILVEQKSSASKDKLLLDDETCTVISSSLIDRLVNPMDDLVDEVVVALQKVVMAWPPALSALIDRSLGALTSPSVKEGSAEDLTALTSRLAFIACSELPKKPADTFTYFISLASQLLKNLGLLLDGPETSMELLTVYPAALQTAMRYLRDALDARLQTDVSNLEFPEAITNQTWGTYVSTKYPALVSIDAPLSEPEKMDCSEDPSSTGSTTLEPSQAYNDYFLICLHISRQLYRRSTRVVVPGDEGSSPFLALSEEISRAGDSVGNWQGQYIHLVSSLATFTVGLLSQSQQSRLRLHEDVIALFRGGDIVSSPLGGEARLKDTLLAPTQPSSVYEKQGLGDLPPRSSLKQCFPIPLALGILQPLHQKVVASLFENGFGQEFIVSTLLALDERVSDPKLGYFLLILANKFKVEAIPKALSLTEYQVKAIVEGTGLTGPDGEAQPVSPDVRTSLAKDIYAVVAGVLRRYTGSSLRQVFSSLLRGPANPEYGHILAREFDIIFRPHPCLKKELNAAVKPLWSQKAYLNLVKPMLPLAWPKRQDASADDATTELSRANYSVAALSCVKHLDYGIYADDAPDFIRLALCALQNLPVGPDAEAALHVLETVAKESPEILEPFLKSVIDACTSLVSGEGAPDLSWMPAGFVPARDGGARVAARCRNLAVVLLGYFPARFDHERLRGVGPRVGRLLAIASGDGVRAVRKAALAARLAWADVR